MSPYNRYTTSYRTGGLAFFTAKKPSVLCITFEESIFSRKTHRTSFLLKSYISILFPKTENKSLGY